MILEIRTYTLHPGKMAEYFKVYEAQGFAIQKRILGSFVGSFVSEIGPLNQVVHLWAFADLNDRAARRTRLAADPQWQAAVAAFIGFFASQESKVMLPSGQTRLLDRLAELEPLTPEGGA
jgi:NIPSNAP